MRNAVSLCDRQTSARKWGGPPAWGYEMLYTASDEPMTGFCERGTEPSALINCRKLHDSL
jgi:hypothetical protein